VLKPKKGWGRKQIIVVSDSNIKCNTNKKDPVNFDALANLHKSAGASFLLSKSRIAVGYARVSTDPQDKGGTSLETQLHGFSHERIAFIDTLLAKFLLVSELLQISEFAALWGQAKEIPEQVVGIIKPKLEAIFINLSEEARGALLLGGKAYDLYDNNAINEAEAAALGLKLLCNSVNGLLQKEGIQPEYRSDLEVLVKPLGVPDLVDVMMILDMKEWGIDRLLSGPVSGPTRDLLETILFRELTGLSPVEAISKTQISLRRRVRQKVGPLGRHLKRYALQRRVGLWVRNVVLGQTITDIACEESAITGFSSYEWVKRQIREGNKILEVKRQPGRPRKGGVLRQWKLMAK